MLKGAGSIADCKINDVGYEADFYNLPTSKTERLGGPRVIEKVLSILEDQWAPIIRELRETRPHVIQPRHRPDIAVYIAVQWLRSRSLGGFLNSSGTHLSSAAGESQIDLILDKNGELSGAVKDIEDMIWILEESASGTPLYTSDFPAAVVLGNATNSPRRTLPRGTRVEFTISPTLVLRAFDRDQNKT